MKPIWIVPCLLIATLAATVSIAIHTIRSSVEALSSHTHAEQLIDAYNRGRKDALRLNPVSWELDEACLALWAKTNLDR